MPALCEKPAYWSVRNHSWFMCYICKSQLEGYASERRELWHELLAAALDGKTTDRELVAMVRQLAVNQVRSKTLTDCLRLHLQQERAEAGERPVLPDLPDGPVVRGEQ